MATKKATATEANTMITIARPEIETIKIRIVGDSPLIVHAWSEKAKKEMLASQQKTQKTKKAREVRRPFAEFCDAHYWLTEKPADNGDDDALCEAYGEAVMNGAKFGFPVSAIKAAAVSAAYRNGYAPNRVSLQGSFFIEGCGINPKEFVEIEGSAPEMREDMVRIGGMSKTSDLRYRPEFKNWHCDVMIRWNKNGLYTLDTIVNAIDLGGLSVGLGEWRIEKGGQFGAFHVEMAEE